MITILREEGSSINKHLPLYSITQVIQAGMFNQHSTNAERKNMLSKLLENDSLEEEVGNLSLVI